MPETGTPLQLQLHAWALDLDDRKQTHNPLESVVAPRRRGMQWPGSGLLGLRDEVMTTQHHCHNVVTNLCSHVSRSIHVLTLQRDSNVGCTRGCSVEGFKQRAGCRQYLERRAFLTCGVGAVQLGCDASVDGASDAGSHYFGKGAGEAVAFRTRI